MMIYTNEDLVPCPIYKYCSSVEQFIDLVKSYETKEGFDEGYEFGFLELDIEKTVDIKKLDSDDYQRCLCVDYYEFDYDEDYVVSDGIRYVVPDVGVHYATTLDIADKETFASVIDHIICSGDPIWDGVLAENKDAMLKADKYRKSIEEKKQIHMSQFITM